uniref:Uncharacterized protein n=1 Tax=Marseillevirus sp. TaxID=2809551 RepID=A0AA96ELN9_9VIRU|nr:hypothetical protein MarFTMF_204 [Marseillevirus sp.]
MPFCVSCGAFVQNPQISKDNHVFCGKGCKTRGNFCQHTGLPERTYLVEQSKYFQRQKYFNKCLLCGWVVQAKMAHISKNQTSAR